MDTQHANINVDCKYFLLPPPHIYKYISSSVHIVFTDAFATPSSVLLRYCSEFFIVLVAAICVLLWPLTLSWLFRVYVCIANLFTRRCHRTFDTPTTWIAISDKLYICCIFLFPSLFFLGMSSLSSVTGCIVWRYTREH